MSFVFEIDGETVWSPSLLAGQAFVGCAQVLGQVVGLLPGFSFNAEDMVELDPRQLQAFTEALAQISTSPMPNRVLESLTDAVRVPCVVLLERAGQTIEFGHDAKTTQLVGEIGASMPQ
jgi:uncharacterized protein DUF6086